MAPQGRIAGVGMTYAQRNYSPDLVVRGMAAMSWVMKHDPETYWSLRGGHGQGCRWGYGPETELPLRDSQLFCDVWETAKAQKTGAWPLHLRLDRGRPTPTDQRVTHRHSFNNPEEPHE
jgi:hypothetical protein